MISAEREKGQGFELYAPAGFAHNLPPRVPRGPSRAGRIKDVARGAFMDAETSSPIARCCSPYSPGRATRRAALHPLASQLGFYLLTLLGGLMPLGCRPEVPASPAPATPVVHRRPAADSLLEEMVRAYRAAPAYSDRGEIVLSYRMGGRRFHDAAPLSVVLERPNRVRLRAYQVDLVGDVGMLQVRITDARTQDLDGQVVVRRAPEELSLSALVEDSMLAELLSRGLGRLPVQLELLLGSSPLSGFRDAETKRRLLDDRLLGEHRCHRVEVRTAEGAFVLWIDAKQFLLRRLEYPAAALASQWPDAAGASDMELIADFTNARFEVSQPEDFILWEVPEQAKIVRRFVRPPQALPSRLFGRPPASFALERLDGSPVGPQQLEGRVAVLHWYVDHPACKASIQQLDKLLEQFSGQVAIYGVCAEPASVSSAQLEDLFAAWNVRLPILRDLAAVGRDIFGVEALPAIVVLDRHGAVQLFEVTYNPQLAEQLGLAIERLQRGEDLGLGIAAQAQQDALDYQHLLAAAGYVGDLPAPTTASRPQTLTLRPRWTMSQLTRPGNVAVVPTPQEPELWVLDDGRQIVRFSADGQVRGGLTLKQAGHERASLLSVLPHEGGLRAFAVADFGGTQVDVYDAQGQRRFAAPPPDLRHGGVRSITWADANGDGAQDLCVGLIDAGLLVWDLEGREVLRAGIAGARSVTKRLDGPAGLWVTGDSGRVAVAAPAEAARPAEPHPLAPVFELYAAGGSRAAPGGSHSVVGVSFDLEGQRVLRGLGEDFSEQWLYRLPGGAYTGPLQWIVPADLPGDHGPGWVLAGADGSIHFVSRDGTFYDYFFSGLPIRGLGVVNTSAGVLLAVTHGTEITAWEILAGE